MLSRQNIVCVVLVTWAAVLVVLTLQSGVTGSIALTGFVCAGLMALAAIVGRICDVWLGPILAVMALTAVGLTVVGVQGASWTVSAAGVVGVVVVGCAFGLSMVLTDVTAPATARGSLPAPRVEELLDKLLDHSMLSDTAKRVLFRDRELALLRSAIEDDIHGGEFNAAIRLCDDLANDFGFRQEAESFRTRIERVRREDYEMQINDALEELDGLLRRRDWQAAHEVADRTRRLFPGRHVGDMVDTRINRARDDHKSQLEHAFVEAANREDIELAMHRLRELDRYLTPGEGNELTEIAETIVSKHRDNLGVQFKLAVNDHRWTDAARTGNTIINEFPNTKMAEEVRSMIDVLRTRASQAAAAEQ